MRPAPPAPPPPMPPRQAWPVRRGPGCPVPTCPALSGVAPPAPPRLPRPDLPRAVRRSPASSAPPAPPPTSAAPRLPRPDLPRPRQCPRFPAPHPYLPPRSPTGRLHECAEDRDHQCGDCTNVRKIAIFGTKIDLLRGHAEKTSTNPRNRQIKLQKLRKRAEDHDHQQSPTGRLHECAEDRDRKCGDCTNVRRIVITHAATARTSAHGLIARSP
jgi:hypothetical protein